MLGISAGMEPKDSSIRALVVILALACAELVLLVILHLSLFLFLSCCPAQMLGCIKLR